jgi:hypothetical protein
VPLNPATEKRNGASAGMELPDAVYLRLARVPLRVDDRSAKTAETIVSDKLRRHGKDHERIVAR